MMCPKCESESLEQEHPGIDTLQDDGDDVSPEETFVAIEYNCPKCGLITMFFDYSRTEQSGDTIHSNSRG